VNADAKSYIHRMEAWAQEESAAQQRLLDVLATQERAAESNDTEALIESTRRLERELSAEPHRARKREELRQGLGRVWKVAPRTLTLRSIAERAGTEGARLRRAADELEQRVHAVQQAGRRLSAVASLRRSILADLIRCLAGDGSAERADGNLVHVEA
jgi:hypothetical protein